MNVVSQEQSSNRNEESISEDSQSETIAPSTSNQVDRKLSIFFPIFQSSYQLKTTEKSPLKAQLAESSLLVSETDKNAIRRRSKRLFAAKTKPAQVYYNKKYFLVKIKIICYLHSSKIKELWNVQEREII